MTGAGEALQAAVVRALGAVAGLGGVYPGPPLQAAFPYATVDAGLESDWSHKSGTGREVRLAVTLRDKGERPARLQQLMAATGGVLDLFGGESGGWRVVTMRFERSRLLPPRASAGEAWAGVIEYRARMLAG
jgi:hypothetical protein